MPKDYLTSLPPELFDCICQLVVTAKPKQYLGGISKAFLSTSRRLCFATTTVRSFQRLQQLCRLVSESSGVAFFVKELRLHLEGEDIGQPRAKELATLFGSLTSTTHLEIEGSARIAKMVLAPKTAGQYLPKLVSLCLLDPFHGWANPFAPDHYANLKHYPHFNVLELTVRRSRASLGRYQQRGRLPDWRPWGWWLSLRGPILGNPAVHDLLSWFEYPEGLYLHETEPLTATESLDSLLDCLPEPDGLRRLSLASFGGQANMAQALTKFNLSYGLEFRSGAYHRDCLPVISKMQELEELSFYDNLCITIRDLTTLITGPDKLASLVKVELHNVWDRWKEEEWIDDFGYELERYGGWSSEFSLSGLAELLKIADEEGVEFEGLAVSLARERLADRRLIEQVSRP
ncbi:hypothetical protein JCM10049v2_007615 [Rhodotorula toruloides]